MAQAGHQRHMSGTRASLDRHLRAAGNERGERRSDCKGMRTAIAEEYVEEVLVKCLSPPSLLSATSMPDGPDVLLIDAEGYDLGIMQRLLKVERFRPAAISFEWSGAFKMALHLHPQERVEEEFDKWIQPLMTELASAGDAWLHAGGPAPGSLSVGGVDEGGCRESGPGGQTGGSPETLTGSGLTKIGSGRDIGGAVALSRSSQSRADPGRL